MTESTGDEALIAAVAVGDARAYRALSDRYLAAILRYAARLLGSVHEAEDVAQETFLRVWQHARSFEVRASRASAWIYRIAHNLCVDRLRKRRPASQLDPDDRAGLDRPSGLLADKQLATQVQAALDELPERQRAVVALVHYEELSQAEAAQVLGTSVEAVESLLARARKALRERLATLHAERRGGFT